MSTIKLREKVQSVRILIDVDSIQESALVNRDSIPYYSAKLLEPVMVKCSTLPEEKPIEMDEVHFLEDLLDKDWQVDEATGGAFLLNDAGKPFVVDFSTTHKVALYQDGYISSWIRSQREERRDIRKADHKSVLQKLREKNKQ